MIIRDNTLTTEQKINLILRTSRLSLSAKGLILYILLTQEDDYDLSIHDLCLAHSCSQRQIEASINALQNFGYIDYEIIKDKNNQIDGKFTIYDTPHEISMVRYDYKTDFIKQLSKADKTFIKQYLTVGKHKKRRKPISVLMEEIRNSIVDWDNIFAYINNELTYGEFLDTEYWAIISQYMKINAKMTCQKCGKKVRVFSKLNVHHKTYDNHGREHLESVQENDLVVYCEECHKEEHVEFDFGG